MNKWIGSGATIVPAVLAVLAMPACDNTIVVPGAGTDGAETDGAETDGPADTGTQPSGASSEDPDGGHLVCGNGVLDEGEECDGTDFGETSCADRGSTGSLRCADDCRIDECSCESVFDRDCDEPVCGNGDLEPGEECEGGKFAGWGAGVDINCELLLGPEGAGPLACTNCTIDTSGCAVCGDGIRDEAYEVCEPGGDATAPCSDVAGPSFEGDASCGDDCQWDPRTCTPLCGNGVIDLGEVCDPGSDTTAPCVDVAGPSFEGDASCGNDCQWNAQVCMPLCGNGVIDPGEGCEGDEVVSTTCIDLGFLSGIPSCVSCQVSDVGCSTCGDGIVGGGETCDGLDLAGATCESLGLTEGTVGCNEDCTNDTTQCGPPFVPSWGNDNIVITEIMFASLADPDFNPGEWFEIHNTSTTDSIDLQGCEVLGENQFETFTIQQSTIVAAESFAVFGQGTAAELGFEPDIALPPQVTFLNAGDVITIECGDVVQDSVTYNDGSPGIALAREYSVNSANGWGEAWCQAPTVYGLGQRGTPGTANDCP